MAVDRRSKSRCQGRACHHADDSRWVALRDLPDVVVVAVVDFLFGPLAADPHRVGKPLRFGLDGYWSARRGQYRVIYSIHDDQVLVLIVRISHRADAYG